MGQAAREKPARLAAKLLQVRTALGLSQNEMLNLLGLTEVISRAKISAYERSVREPSLLVLLKYARVAGVYVDALIDDSIDLPEKLPACSRYKWALQQ